MPALAGWDNFYIIVGSSAAALLATPGHTMLTLSVSLGACGVAGLGFTRWVLLQMRRQTVYKPVGDDWLWHVGMPLLAYLFLFLGAAGLWWRPGLALVVVAGAILFLLYIGIHNAWDAAIYVSVARTQNAQARRGPNA